MKKYYTRSDLAIESLAHAIQDKDYKHDEKKDGDITIETFEILQKSDLYPHEVGQYVETLWTRTQKADHETGAADNK